MAGKAAKPAEQAAAEQAAAEQAAAEQAAAEQAAAEQAAAEQAEPIAEGDVTVIVAIAISGTRNGEPWPAAGEQITLPAAEAAGYLQFGYVREVESAE